MIAFQFWVKHSLLNKRKEQRYKTSYKTYQIYNSNMKKKKNKYDLSGKFIVIIIFIVIKTLEAHEKKHFVGKF